MTQEQATFEAATAQRIIKISGCIPGMLDSTQVQRLCRHPKSKLTFASFDPRTASVQIEVPDIRKLSLNQELFRPKRIVIETVPSGESFWRFVPNARKEEGVTDEGRWPRVIKICGQHVECTQDQWDIYKLDPLYDCHVRNYPGLTEITRATPKSTSSEATGAKRRVLSPSPGGPDGSSQPRKKMFQNFSPSESDEESEVEDMIIDDSQKTNSANYHDFMKKRREHAHRVRQERREKLTRRMDKLSQENQGSAVFDFPSMTDGDSKTSPPGNVEKRKAHTMYASLKTLDNPDCDGPVADKRNGPQYVNGNSGNEHKRARVVNPFYARRVLGTKRLQREKRKRERQEMEMRARRAEKERIAIYELYPDIPEVDIPDAMTDNEDTPNTWTFNNANGNHSSADDNEETVRQAAIEESRRKLAELEKDRPLWEEAAKKRREREQAEEETLRKRKEEKARAAAAQEEAVRQACRAKELEEARRREEAERARREHAARRECEKRMRNERWSHGRWSASRAVEKYKTLCESFDTAKFSVSDPLDPDDVPWPILHSPATFTLEDVSWTCVEEFFRHCQMSMRTQDFRIFVEKSHRRFHPDRWRSRSLLKTVADETLRSCMEVAANTVAQAITPLWQEVTGRT